MCFLFRVGFKDFLIKLHYLILFLIEFETLPVEVQQVWYIIALILAEIQYIIDTKTYIEYKVTVPPKRKQVPKVIDNESNDNSDEED